jgi:hypothetical protein
MISPRLLTTSQTWVDKAATCPMCRRDLAGLGCVLKVSGPELADKVRRLWLDAPTDLPVHRDF